MDIGSWACGREVKAMLSAEDYTMSAGGTWRRKDRADSSSHPINSTLLLNCPSVLAADTERHKSVTENVTNPPQTGTSNEPWATRIQEWINDTHGWFGYDDLDRDLGIHTSDEKHNRRMILKRLRDGGTIESHPRHNKLCRRVDANMRLIDFKAASKRTPLAIGFPFDIQKKVNTYPGNIIVLAGDADSGKTAFLLNFIRLNMYDFSIFYQSSEMGKEELAARLSNFEGLELQDCNFTAEERSHDFQDVIRPSCINIVDYLELAGDFYQVAEYLRQIHDKLDGGIAIVALQKKRGAELGRGGDFGLEKPRLYLSMGNGTMTIQKAKNWANPAENPNGLAIEFKIVRGCDFMVTRDWHKRDG